MSTVEVTWSELLREGNEVVAKLGHQRRLLVHRRDADDLVLTTAVRVAQEDELLHVTTRFLVELIQAPAGRSSYFPELVSRVFPWVRFLPEADRTEFARELVDVMKACEDIDTTAPILQTIAEWRHTAEAHADPVVAGALRRGVVDDAGPVPAPAG